MLDKTLEKNKSAKMLTQAEDLEARINYLRVFLDREIDDVVEARGEVHVQNVVKKSIDSNGAEVESEFKGSRPAKFSEAIDAFKTIDQMQRTAGKNMSDAIKEFKIAQLYGDVGLDVYLKLAKARKSFEEAYEFLQKQDVTIGDIQVGVSRINNVQDYVKLQRLSFTEKVLFDAFVTVANQENLSRNSEKIRAMMNDDMVYGDYACVEDAPARKLTKEYAEGGKRLLDEIVHEYCQANKGKDLNLFLPVVENSSGDSKTKSNTQQFCINPEFRKLIVSRVTHLEEQLAEVVLKDKLKEEEAAAVAAAAVAAITGSIKCAGTIADLGIKFERSKEPKSSTVATFVGKVDKNNRERIVEAINLAFRQEGLLNKIMPDGRSKLVSCEVIPTVSGPNLKISGDKAVVESLMHLVNLYHPKKVSEPKSLSSRSEPKSSISESPRSKASYSDSRNIPNSPRSASPEPFAASSATPIKLGAFDKLTTSFKSFFPSLSSSPSPASTPTKKSGVLVVIRNEESTASKRKGSLPQSSQAASYSNVVASDLQRSSSPTFRSSLKGVAESPKSTSSRPSSLMGWRGATSYGGFFNTTKKPAAVREVRTTNDLPVARLKPS